MACLEESSSKQSRGPASVGQPHKKLCKLSTRSSWLGRNLFPLRRDGPHCKGPDRQGWCRTGEVAWDTCRRISLGTCAPAGSAPSYPRRTLCHIYPNPTILKYRSPQHHLHKPLSPALAQRKPSRRFHRLTMDANGIAGCGLCRKRSTGPIPERRNLIGKGYPPCNLLHCTDAPLEDQRHKACLERRPLHG